MDRCSLCPNINACLPPDGPDDAELLFIGEAPGKVENQKGRVFIGKTGDEVNRHYLPLAGLRRESVLFTNAIGCLPTSSGGKLDAGRAGDIRLLHECSAHRLHPILPGRRLLIPLGTFACRSLDPTINLELHHGIPRQTEWGTVFPMYHPALGIYEPKKMLMIRTDWQRLRQFLAGKLVLPQDPYPEPDYAEVTDVSEIRGLRVASGDLAIDTETTRSRSPYCLTFSTRPGSGRLIRAERRDLLRAFQEELQVGTGRVVLHNLLYDWPILETMGVALPLRRVVDTMVRTFHLGNLPQGLKALALRELGMEMQDFDDVVTPHSRDNVLHYYHIAASYDWPRPEEQVVQDSKTGTWKLYKPQSMSTKFKRLFTDLSKNPEKNVFDMWENWEKEHAAIEAVCGPWPGKCISHAPFTDVLHYACRDADATLRLWPLLRRMGRRVRKVSQEHWRAA